MHFVSKIHKILFVTLILITHISFASLKTDVHEFEIVDAKHNVHLKGIHATRRGATAILKDVDQVRYIAPLFDHGLTGTSRNWREMIYKINELGESHVYEEIQNGRRVRVQVIIDDYFALNWRGHGNGHLRSHPLQSEDGAYGFDNIVANDPYAILNAVESQLKEKYPERNYEIYMAGHSMGGMITMNTHDSRIDGKIIIGSPFSFDMLPNWLVWAKPILSLLKRFMPEKADIPGFGPRQAQTLPDDQSLRARFKKMYQREVVKILRTTPVQMITKGLLNSKSLHVGDEEFESLLAKGMSEAVHSDLFVEDFGRFVETGQYVSRDGKINYSDARPDVNTLLIHARGDSLVSWAAVQRDLDQWEQEGYGDKMWRAEYALAGHTDLIVGRQAANIVGQLIFDFMVKPTRLGPPGSRLLVHPKMNAGKCIMILSGEESVRKAS